jgi:hypothetical protein
MAVESSLFPMPKKPHYLLLTLNELRGTNSLASWASLAAW